MGWWRDFTDRNLCFATFFSTKKYWKKKCPNIILISSRWSTECFKSDGRKTLQIEIFVLQHFFRKRHWKHMSKYHCNDFEMIHWMSWKRLLKDVAQDETFQFQDELKSFILLSVSFSFFGGSPRWFPCGSPLWLPVVLTVARAPQGRFSPQRLVGLPFSTNARARVYRARLRVGVTQFASRNLGDGKYLEGFGTQMIIKLWSYIMSKLIDFLLLCVPQRVPPTNGGDPWFPMQILILGKSWIFNCLGKNIAPWNRTIFLLLLNERITFFEAS